MMDQSSKPVIIYDLVLCPRGVEIEKIIYAYEKTGFVFYDSTFAKGEAHAPYLLAKQEVNPEIMIDISTVEYQEFTKRFNKNG